MPTYNPWNSSDKHSEILLTNSDLTVDETFAIVYQFAKEKLD